jgi:hypothetical protein
VLTFPQLLVGYSEFLIFAEGKNLHSLTLDSHQTSRHSAFDKISGFQKTVALDFDAVNNVIYYTDSEAKKIGKVSGPEWNNPTDLITNSPSSTLLKSLLVLFDLKLDFMQA